MRGTGPYVFRVFLWSRDPKVFKGREKFHFITVRTRTRYVNQVLKIAAGILSDEPGMKNWVPRDAEQVRPLGE